VTKIIFEKFEKNLKKDEKKGKVRYKDT